MSEHKLTEEQIREMCKPKSDQLNYDDARNHPLVFRVADVTAGDKEHPLFVYMEGEPRPYKPSKNMIRVFAGAWTDKGWEWVGKWVELYGDPTVKFGGVEVGGLKIGKLSHIPAPMEFKLTVSRNVRVSHRVDVLKIPDTLTAEDQAYIAEVLTEIQSAPSQEVMKALGSVIKLRSKGVQDAVRSAYAAKVAELKAKEAGQ